jgi:hypothetical protein
MDDYGVTGATVQVEVLVPLEVERSGGEDVPFAHWDYELQAQGEETLIRQSFTHGPGNSGMRQGVLADPARAEESKQRRLDQLGRNMELTIAAMTRAIRGPAR